MKKSNKPLPDFRVALPTSVTEEEVNEKEEREETKQIKIRTHLMADIRFKSSLTDGKILKQAKRK